MRNSKGFVRKIST